ncbi:MAG: hypothetical protein KGL52_01165 [Rhodospirillales bacterium]|nr:hypothetical protein [Rhodospirillales bacterium]
MAIISGLAEATRDIERWRAEQRNQREAAIREAAERQAGAIERLRSVMPSDDPIFGKRAAGATQPVPGAAELTRQKVFAHLNAGRRRDELPAEAAEFVADWERSRSAW